MKRPPSLVAPSRGGNLVTLRPRGESVHISRGDTVLAAQGDGWLEDGADQGLFVLQTRVLSRYRCFLGRRKPLVAAASSTCQDRWLAYYIVPAPGEGEGKPVVSAAAQQTIELEVTRVVGDGMHEDFVLNNHTQKPARITLALEVDADFADIEETRGERRQQGRLRKAWRRDGDVHELAFDYAVARAWQHDGRRGRSTFRRGVAMRIHCTSAPPRRRGGRIVFNVELAPRGRWHVCVDWVPSVDGTALRTPPCPFGATPATALFLREATRFGASNSATLTDIVIESLEQARYDLNALRLPRLDRDERAWTFAAGVPGYVALFGRDTLFAAAQASLLGPEPLRGTLEALAALQGKTDDAWRDEQPGRILHEAQTGPVSALQFKPLDRYYGSLTTASLYASGLAQLWAWTADRAVVEALLDTALKALAWLDAEAVDARGFYACGTRSREGLKNQSWKDSDDSAVHADGAQAELPIASCEEQGAAYAAKLALAPVLWALGRREDARRLAAEARDLAHRFEAAFWIEELGFYAMAIDAAGNALRSIASNAVHCVSTGIARPERAARVAERALAPDLFSGWGFRTLSADHPAYNPYAYHRGTVWPAEHGAFALGARRYGLHAAAERVARCQFEIASLFDHRRLPECFGGQPRDELHPFPSLYPSANGPQAWSGTTLFALVRSLLGLDPYAARGVLLVDPHLPEWLPELVLERLRVGDAAVTLRFTRGPDGTSECDARVLEGSLRVLRRVADWTLPAAFGANAERMWADLERDTRGARKLRHG